jgi:predicted GH43/DUF377 family glycosyl hydrolase
MQHLFQRAPENPILTAEDLDFAAGAVLNPGATEQDGTTVLLLRVEDAGGRSSIHVARSADGVTDWQVEREPLLGYGDPRWRYETWGCEDARVTYIAEHECWYITYTAYSSNGASVGLARTKDFAAVERIGLIFSPNNKDAALFPQRINGKWMVLHRPDAGGMENIWIASSPDFVNWGEPHCVLEEGSGADWDAVKVGAGPPPLLTDRGWLVLYHGVKVYGSQLVYRVGAAMLEKDRPHKVMARTPRSIFKATEIYEQAGLIPNVVFPTGLVMRADELWLYYGAADTCVCLATAKLADVLETLEPVS